MCWAVGVFIRVFGNLATRIWCDIFDAGYKMCSICFCATQITTADDDIVLEYREQFYKKVNREQAAALLRDKQDGTFIVRPSSSTDGVGTLSVVQDGQVFHLVIRRRRRDGLIALGTPKQGEKCFADMNSLINYHVSNYLVLFSDNKTCYTLLLPYYD